LTHLGTKKCFIKRGLSIKWINILDKHQGESAGSDSSRSREWKSAADVAKRSLRKPRKQFGCRDVFCLFVCLF
jgi:hypothetical protein